MFGFTGFSLGALLLITGLHRGFSAPVFDFSLKDVNPQSVRADSSVSPRDYILQVSGYYFGHAS